MEVRTIKIKPWRSYLPALVRASAGRDSKTLSRKEKIACVPLSECFDHFSFPLIHKSPLWLSCCNHQASCFESQSSPAVVSGCRYRHRTCSLALTGGRRQRERERERGTKERALRERELKRVQKRAQGRGSHIHSLLSSYVLCPPKGEAAVRLLWFSYNIIILIFIPNL